MKTIAESTIVPPKADSSQMSTSSTIALQPTGPLDKANSLAFQKMLEDSLEQATEAVIVDMLWIESTDSNGIAVLVAGIQRAAALGKSLSFLSMDRLTRTALETEWNRQRELNFGPWNDLFAQDLEQFLDNLP